MNEYSYVPSLKSKRGERLALKELSTEVKSKIKPILNVINNDDFGKFYDGKAFIDLHDNILMDADDQKIKDTFKLIHETASKKSELTSVLKHDYSKKLLELIKPYLFNVDKGIALRIPQEHLSNLELNIKTISEVLSIDSSMIDVIIDFGCINDLAIGLVKPLSDHIKKAISKLHINNIIVLASAFPISIRVPSNTISELSRYDWLLYSGLKKLLPDVIFGDYGSDDPFDPKIDTRMNIVPTIRYTSGDCWKIVRGCYDPKAPYDYSQYYDLSRTLVGCAFYKGSKYSWGDNRIFECANGGCSYGSPETWVRVAVNHHITFVSNECDHLL